MGQLTSIAVAESRKATAEYHETTADSNGKLTPPPISYVWPSSRISSVAGLQKLWEHNSREEETNDGADVEHVDQDTELIGITRLREVFAPEVDLLGSIDKHTDQTFSLNLHLSQE